MSDNKRDNNVILLVDDSINNLQLLGNLLKNEDYQIALAKNGKEALNIVKEVVPELILLDIMMPEMDGYTVCRELKKNPQTKDIPIIFLTAKTTKEDIVKGFNTGGVDYITKPFNREELLARIKTHLELKKARDKITQQRKELEESNATKDKMFSVISHDLRAPLGGMKSMLDLVYEDKNEGKNINKKSLDSLKKAADKTYNLLENLLYWSRSQRGQLVYEPEHINLYDLVIENVELLKTMIDNKKIHISNEISDDLNAYADRNMVKTIIRNLIYNAIKFTKEEGEVKIYSKKEGDYIILSVEDNGIGITKENLEKIFNRKEYFTTYGTEREKGSGLGLNLIFDFLDKNKGELFIDSDYGKGSTFSFSLPVAPKS
jgi:two-component system sensor histidine kinase/response regulator